MTQKHENQVPQNSSDPNSAPTPLFDLNAILGPDPEGEIPDGGDIREYPSRICWFSELLGRICDDSYLDSEAKKLVEEKRDAYLETLKRGSNAKELFDSLVDYVLELASVIPPASPKADGEDPKITQSSSLFLPLSVAYIRMTSPEELDARDCNMDDMQLQGILRSRQSGLGIVKRVNVSGNNLSDAAVCSLTKDLVQSEAKLETLDLSGNQLISDRTYLDLCQRLRSLQFTSLQSLSIAGIHVHGAAMLELLSNLNSSTTPSLECLNLADTQLGMRDDVGCDALAATLSQIRKLSSLDISHNYMRAKHLHIIGESLALMDSISVLNISSNSGGMLPSEPKLPAIASLCSVLGSIASLTEVYLASTGMNDETAFILSDSLANHHNIKRIDISGNANVGRFGIFSLLKLLLFKKDGVNSINLNDSLRNTNTRVFNFADPSGTYSLNLQSLRDIAIARQCFNIWELSRALLEKTLIGIEIDSKPFVPMKDAEEVWQLPERGILRFTATFKLFNEDGTLSEVGKPTVITREIMHRFVSGVYSEIRSVEQKQILLHSIASNFEFSCDLVDLLERSSSSRLLTTLITETLLPKTVNPLPTIAFMEKAFKKVKYPFRFHSVSTGPPSSAAYTHFNLNNPSGYYRLNLSNPAHRFTAVAAILRAKEENDGFKDVANFSVLRNCKLNGTAVKTEYDWTPPDCGIWEFDYITPQPSARKSLGQVIDSQAWLTFVQTFVAMNSSCGRDQCLLELRKVSHRIRITCAQLVDLLARFPSDTDFRLDITVTLIRRVSDFYNLKEMLFRDRLGLPATFEAQALVRLEGRVGKMALFNPLKLENTTNECDLSTEEGRSIAKTILTLLSKEKGSRLVISRVGVTQDKMPPGEPPKNWFVRLPETGWWAVTYVVEEKSINMKLRKDLAVRFCGFHQSTVETF